MSLPAAQTSEAEAASDSAPSSLASLPDHLLSKALSLLDAADRHRAALVSRRWDASAHSPDLCRTVVLHVSRARSVTLLQSLLAWLTRHGQHVHTLGLALVCDAESSQELLQLFESCVAACAAAGGHLLHLEVHWSSDAADSLVVGEWAAALGSLERLLLTFQTFGALRLSHSLHHLTALRHLSLACRMDLLAGLTALHTLRLWTGMWSSASFTPLLELPALRCLRLSCRYLPDCLPLLTALEDLALSVPELGDGQDTAAVNEALQGLTALTSLVILDNEPRSSLPAIASLSRLKRAALVHLVQPLPSGPWIAHLQLLGARYASLAGSVDVLARASGLEHLAVVVDFRSTAVLISQAERFWRWAARHPPLRRVQVHLGEDASKAQLIDIVPRVLELQIARPGLQISCSHTELLEFYELFRDS